MFSFEIDDNRGLSSPVVRPSRESFDQPLNSSAPERRRNSNISEIKIFNNIDIIPIARKT